MPASKLFGLGRRNCVLHISSNAMLGSCDASSNAWLWLWLFFILHNSISITKLRDRLPPRRVGRVAELLDQLG
eukprot:COSAG06_NODE_34993_length_466_cov_0.839237_1_plen_72_part_01